MKKFRLNYLEIKIPKEFRNLAMNAILINNLSYKKSEILDDLSLLIIISAKHKRDFEKAFRDNSVTAEFSKPRGILPLLKRYKHRYGIILGALILVVLLNLSSQFVWRIDISGNTTISDEQIVQELDAVGFKLGSFIPRVDYDRLHNSFLMKSDDISWISVNITGNVASVRVRERLCELEQEGMTYTNVLSKYDAQIALIQIYNGKKVISIGDIVKKGDLLISGVIDSQSQGVRYVHADGKVMGYVRKPISIKIPLKSAEKVYTDTIYKEKSVKIFSKEINFSPKCRNYNNFYDKINKKEKLRLFGCIELPIEIITTYYREFKYNEVVYTYSQAVDIAFSHLRQELDQNTKNAELISKKVKTSYDSDFFYLDCELYCYENIATLIAFDVQ